MKLQVVSYIPALSPQARIELTANIINQSKADLILFSGYTLVKASDVATLQSLIINKKPEVILEVQSNDNGIPKALYHLKNGIISNLYTNQLFTNSKEVNEELVDWLINELGTRRMFRVCGKTLTILQCGENGIIRNIQSESNKAVFRYNTNAILSERFNTILNSVDIFLNPIHSPMGNQGKMHKRREYLSADNRYYFSTSNTDDENQDLKHKLQYAYYDGCIIDECEIIGDECNYISRVFEIK